MSRNSDFARAKKQQLQKASIRRRRRGGVLIAIGLVLVAVAIGLAAYNWWDSNRAGDAAGSVQNQLAAAENDPSSGGGKKADSVMIDGVEYLGTLEVPSLDLTLPVARNWSYDQLNISPCRYTGSAAKDDLVICAHNYATHFGPLENADIGADVYFTPVGGERIHYIIGNRETVQPTSIQQMVENSHNSDRSEKWDLTLFTCTPDGQARVTVRCLREKS